VYVPAVVIDIPLKAAMPFCANIVVEPRRVVPGGPLAMESVTDGLPEIVLPKASSIRTVILGEMGVPAMMLEGGGDITTEAGAAGLTVNDDDRTEATPAIEASSE
jgi:hypothetical protein